MVFRLPTEPFVPRHPLRPRRAGVTGIPSRTMKRRRHGGGRFAPSLRLLRVSPYHRHRPSGGPRHAFDDSAACLLLAPALYAAEPRTGRTGAARTPTAPPRATRRPPGTPRRTSSGRRPSPARGRPRPSSGATRSSSSRRSIPAARPTPPTSRAAEPQARQEDERPGHLAPVPRPVLRPARRQGTLAEGRRRARPARGAPPHAQLRRRLPRDRRQAPHRLVRLLRRVRLRPRRQAPVEARPRPDGHPPRLGRGEHAGPLRRPRRHRLGPRGGVVHHRPRRGHRQDGLEGRSATR